MVSNLQRALWTFLIYALVGPFFAGLCVAAAVGLAPPLGIGSLLPDGIAPLGPSAVAAFVWSAVPAMLTGLVLAGVVWRTGGMSWFVAVAVAIIAFAAAAMVLPLHLDGARPYLAFLAGLVSLAVRQVLIQGDIIGE
jgi:hypothetical protein